jgi:uncharacterized protein (TIGR02118 family)
MTEASAGTSEQIRCIVLLSSDDATECAGLQQAWLDADPIPPLVADVPRRYVRSLPLPSEQRGFNPRELFGVAQLWVDGIDTALAVCEDLSRALSQQEAGFRGFGSKVIPMREYVVIDGPERPGGGDGIKALFFACRRPGMTVSAFQDHWRNVHGPLVPGTPGLARYVQCHPCPEGYDRLQPAYDSMAELTFADEAGLVAFNGPSSHRDAQGADLPNLWDMTVRTPRIYIQDVFDGAIPA